MWFSGVNQKEKTMSQNIHTRPHKCQTTRTACILQLQHKFKAYRFCGSVKNTPHYIQNPTNCSSLRKNKVGNTGRRISWPPQPISPQFQKSRTLKQQRQSLSLLHSFQRLHHDKADLANGAHLHNFTQLVCYPSTLKYFREISTFVFLFQKENTCASANAFVYAHTPGIFLFLRWI